MKKNRYKKKIAFGIEEYEENKRKALDDDLILSNKSSSVKLDKMSRSKSYMRLKGAKKTICNYRPKMAICVYHKPEDLWTIPGLLLEYDSTYRFKLRQYQTWYAECVLYAY